VVTDSVPSLDTAVKAILPDLSKLMNDAKASDGPGLEELEARLRELEKTARDKTNDCNLIVWFVGGQGPRTFSYGDSKQIALNFKTG